MPMVDPDTINLIGYIASGVFVALVTISALTVVMRWMSIKSRRAKQLKELRAEEDYADLYFDKGLRASVLSDRINGWVERLTGNPKYGARMRQKLLVAGIFNPDGTSIFILARIVLALFLPLGFFALFQIFAPDTSSVVAFGVPVFVALIGLFLPDFYLSRRQKNYEDECRRGFPDFLDLLVVATDAGMGLEQAIGRVGGEIIKTSPGLGASIALMSLEIRMGQGFSVALTNFVARTGIDEIRSFATLLQQSRELGSSVTAALRIYSEDMRHKRLSAAEEKAYALPAKMVIPLAVFLFPVVSLIVMLPVVVRIAETMASKSN